MCRVGTVGARLYRGEVSFDFVGRRRSGTPSPRVLLTVSILALLFRGLNLGIEFQRRRGVPGHLADGQPSSRSRRRP